MAENTNNISLDDYIIVELADGKFGKTTLQGLDALFLPISNIGKVAEFEEEINDLSIYLLNISSEFAANMQDISELNEKFERKVDTDYMLQDPNILTQDRIETILSGKEYATIDDLNDAFDESLENIDEDFTKTNDNIEEWLEEEET